MNVESIIEALFGGGLLVNALLFVPQIIRLIKTKNSNGMSLLTFSGFCALQFLTILHGYYHHDPALIIGYLFSLLTCGTVTFLIVKYRSEVNR